MIRNRARIGVSVASDTTGVRKAILGAALPDLLDKRPSLVAGVALWWVDGRPGLEAIRRGLYR